MWSVHQNAKATKTWLDMPEIRPRILSAHCLTLFKAAKIENVKGHLASVSLLPAGFWGCGEHEEVTLKGVQDTFSEIWFGASQLVWGFLVFLDSGGDCLSSPSFVGLPHLTLSLCSFVVLLTFLSLFYFVFALVVDYSVSWCCWFDRNLICLQFWLLWLVYDLGSVCFSYCLGCSYCSLSLSLLGCLVFVLTRLHLSRCLAILCCHCCSCCHCRLLPLLLCRRGHCCGCYFRGHVVFVVALVLLLFSSSLVLRLVVILSSF